MYGSCVVFSFFPHCLKTHRLRRYAHSGCGDLFFRELFHLVLYGAAYAYPAGIYVRAHMHMHHTSENSCSVMYVRWASGMMLCRDSGRCWWWWMRFSKMKIRLWECVCGSGIGDRPSSDKDMCGRDLCTSTCILCTCFSSARREVCSEVVLLLLFIFLLMFPSRRLFNAAAIQSRSWGTSRKI